jgi:hypothetical protein
MHAWYRAFWVTSTLDDPMPGVPGPEPEFVNFEKLRSPGTDSKVSIPLAWVAGGLGSLKVYTFGLGH